MSNIYKRNNVNSSTDFDTISPKCSFDTWGDIEFVLQKKFIEETENSFELITCILAGLIFFEKLFNEFCTNVIHIQAFLI